MDVVTSNRDWFSWSGVLSIQEECEAQAAKEGLTGLALIMRSQELFTDALNSRQTYRERQGKWLAKQKANTVPNPLREALRQIAEGHNDPRRLAHDVLYGKSSED